MSLSDFGGVKKDVQIIIQRSNGSKHEAMVTEVVLPNTVQCEWFESDDIKGKGVSLQQVFDLNPQLRPKHYTKPKRPQEDISRKSVMIAPASRLKKENIAPAVRKVDVTAIKPESRLPTAKSKVRKTELLPKRSEAVVRNIEKIEVDRKDRRDNQSRARYQRDQIRSKHDVNDGQWEFAEMICAWREENPAHKPVFRRMNHKINVCVRKRPLNKKEKKNKETDVVTRSADMLYVHEPKTKVDLTKFLENQTFRFDYVFDLEDDNRQVYEYTAKPLVESIFDGAQATCFAYGQTGSGKTHTMGGEFSGKNQNCSNGIYAFAAEDVFKKLRQPVYQHLSLHVSFFEIYANKVFDLLNDSNKLRILEDKNGKIRIVGLIATEVYDVNDVINVLREGSVVRTSGQTSANSNSSRSHAVFQLSLVAAGRSPLDLRTHGMFSLIDLAGNERGADTMSSDRTTRQEGADINKSLLALKECIRAMGKDATHIPFRGSTLTKVLRDSFLGAKSRTCMIATLSPGFSSCENTINTLRYADRVKGLSTRGQEGRELEDLMEEVTLNSESEEDSHLNLLATQNAEQFTPEMLAVTKAQEDFEKAEQSVVDQTSSLIPKSLSEIGNYQKLWTEAESQKNPDTPDIFRQMLEANRNLQQALKNAEENLVSALEKNEKVDSLIRQQQHKKQEKSSRSGIPSQGRRFK